MYEVTVNICLKLIVTFGCNMKVHAAKVELKNNSEILIISKWVTSILK
jgi:hypothetical protein